MSSCYLVIYVKLLSGMSLFLFQNPVFWAVLSLFLSMGAGRSECRRHSKTHKGMVIVSCFNKGFFDKHLQISLALCRKLDPDLKV